MDLSWCIICDRHCVDNSLYCSESCRFQDNLHDNSKSSKEFYQSSAPNSPVLTPFLYSFHNEHQRRKASVNNITPINANNSSLKEHSYFPYRFTPGSPSKSSLFADDT